MILFLQQMRKSPRWLTEGAMHFLSFLLIVALLLPSAAWAHCETCPTDDGGGVIVVSEPTPTYYYDSGTGRSVSSEAAAALLGLVVVGAVVLYFAQFHQPRAVMVTSQNYAPPIAYQQPPMPQYQYQQQPYYPQQYYSYGAPRGNYYGGYQYQQPSLTYGDYYGYSGGTAPCPPQSYHGYSRIRR